MVGGRMTGILKTISKTPITTYNQLFIAVHVEINYELYPVLMFLWPALLWECICSLEQYCWDLPPSLNSPTVFGQVRELTRHGQRFAPPPPLLQQNCCACQQP